MASNPWEGLPYWNGESTYIRDPVPWDSRERGTEALSDEQEAATEAFTSASKSSVEACADKTSTGTFVCRASFIEDQLEGKSY